MTRAIVVFSVLLIFFAARPHSFASLPRNTGGERRIMLLLHFAGVLLLFIPVAALALMPGSGLENRFAVPWALGSLLASVGIIFWYSGPRGWISWLKKEKFAPLLAVGIAFIIPDLAVWGRGLWGLESLSRLTFDSVYQVLFQLGGTPFSNPEEYAIGLGDFVVRIADGCSGIEGFVLITVFTGLYGFMFRNELRFPHYWIMIPLGIAVSWVFNVLRISLLVWIGANISPELAIEGFHSYAGWIAFTMLALAVLWVSNSIPWFRKRETVKVVAAPLPPLRQDWNAARLFPFVVFMLSGVLTSAFFTIPAVGYPLKAAAMFLVLVYFRHLYREKIEWSLDWIAVGAGAFIGVLWLVLLPYGNSDDGGLALALRDLGTVGFALWVLMRVAGTVFLVPIIEELVFRGYILAGIDRGDTKSRLLAIAVSTALFALLHGRWFAAGIAGVVFALAYLRRGKLADAIIAHMVANLIVAVWALFRQDWGAI